MTPFFVEKKKKIVSYKEHNCSFLYIYKRITTSDKTDPRLSVMI